MGGATALADIWAEDESGYAELVTNAEQAAAVQARGVRHVQPMHVFQLPVGWEPPPEPVVKEPEPVVRKARGRARRYVYDAEDFVSTSAIEWSEVCCLRVGGRDGNGNRRIKRPSLDWYERYPSD